ncbi:MAG: response regulator [Aeromicrobium sp.]|nr:response regulator [Aeromicrobium sp.]
MGAHRVLIVEDTDLLRRMYRDRLSQDGYEVLEATDGLAALTVLRDERVDLILLDLIMPRMGGIEVLEAISADPRTKGTPVVVLTNLGEEDTIERAVALGALDYLLKNETRPNDVSEKVRLTLSAFHAPDEAATSAFRIRVRDREDDADALISHAELKRRFWCPACENELALELVPVPEHHGHYDARFICPACGRDFAI